MKKSRKVMIYALVVIIFILIIPDVVVRMITPEQLARLSDFTSLGGMLNHLLSLLIFLILVSIILAAIAISVMGKIYRAISWSKNK